MATETQEIRQGSTAQALDGTLTAADRTAQGLGGATVTVSMRSVRTGALVIDARPCTILDAAAGKVTAPLLAADVATPGEFYFWFDVRFADTTTLRFPEVESLGLSILPTAPTTFFDAGIPAHRALLPLGLRGHEDLDNIAAAAEADVLGEYTGIYRPGHRRHHGVWYADGSLAGWDGGMCERWFSIGSTVPAVPGALVVFLRGYTGDPLTTEAGLAAALRREIAGVIRWRAARDAKKPGVTSESAGDPATTKAYDAALEHALPPDFGRALRPYVTRPHVWTL